MLGFRIRRGVEEIIHLKKDFFFLLSRVVRSSRLSCYLSQPIPLCECVCVCAYVFVSDSTCAHVCAWMGQEAALSCMDLLLKFEQF